MSGLNEAFNCVGQSEKNSVYVDYSDIHGAPFGHSGNVWTISQSRYHYDVRQACLCLWEGKKTKEKIKWSCNSSSFYAEINHIQLTDYAGMLVHVECIASDFSAKWMLPFAATALKSQTVHATDIALLPYSVIPNLNVKLFWKKGSKVSQWCDNILHEWRIKLRKWQKKRRKKN